VCWSASGLAISLYVICSFSTLVGKQITYDDIVIGLEEVIDVQPWEARQFGIAGPIPNLFRDVWKDERRVFAAEGSSPGTGGMTQELGHPERTSSHTLHQYPVEVFAIKEPSKAHENIIGHGGWMHANLFIYPTT
jgi:hypothetical protein